MHIKRFLLLGVLAFLLQSVSAQIDVLFPSSYFICSDESVVLEPTVTGGDGNYTYEWSPSESLSEPTIANPTATPAQTTTYSLTVTDGVGVQGTASVEVFVAIIELSGNISDAACGQAQDGSIFTTVSGGSPPYIYQWNNGASTSSLTNLAAGIYTLTVTDANGCTVMENFQISSTATAIEVDIDVVGTDCDDNTGIITATASNGTAPYDYTWSNGHVGSPVGGLTAGVYYLTTTDANGCFVTQTVEVGNNAGFEVNITTDQEGPLCAGEFVELTAEHTGGEAPFSYQWEIGENSQSITVVPPAQTPSYTVTVTDNNGCQAVSAITLDVAPPMNITTGPDQILNCATTSINLDFIVSGGVAPYTYLWVTGETGPALTVSEPGSYCVTITDAIGCQAEECVTVLQDTALPQLTITGIPVDPCDNDYDILAEVTVTGQDVFSILWTGPNGFANTSFALNGDNGLENGTYTATVTNALNACVTSESFDLNQAIPSVNVMDGFLDCVNSEYTYAYEGTLNNPEYTTTWVGPNGFISEEMSFTTSIAGAYALTVSNENFPECGTSTQNLTVHAPPTDFTSDIIVSSPNCQGYFLSALIPDDYFGETEILWTYPDGTTATSLSITATSSGVYTMHLNLVALNCEYYVSEYIDVTNAVCSHLQGYVRFDESEDCIADESEIGLQNRVVTAEGEGETYHAVTDEDGFYSFFIPAGNYSVSTTLPSVNWASCQEEYDVSLSASDNQTLNIPLQAAVECPELSVSLESSLLRRCFNGYYQLSVCNNGTAVAENPELTVVLDDFLNSPGANSWIDSVNGQELYGALPNLNIGECIEIYISFEVSCNATLGQTHCTEAFVTEYLDCMTNDGWSGANLELQANCDGNNVVFDVLNTGTADLAETVNFIVIEDGIAMMDAPSTIDDLPVNDSRSFDYPANGATYTFRLDQAANHPYTMTVTSSIEGCGEGDFSIGYVNQFEQQTATPASTVFCEENIGSYDPNDKAAIPVGYGEEHYIEPENRINYRIRFQNTGTDTAFTVVVKDELSELLDITSIELGASSHDYTARIEGERELIFTFDNILLVDSFTNEPASNGFVYFSIKPKADAPLESIINNEAAIYFDFNEPVITNTVFHTLGRDFYQIVNWTDLGAESLALEVYPNPTTNFIRIGSMNELVDRHSLRILDATGKLIHEAVFEGRELEIAVENWPSSYYNIQLLNENGQVVGTAQLIKN